MITVVGVLGGLGPAASALLNRHVVDAALRTGNKVNDEDHPAVLYYVNPRLPNSRLAALGREVSPVPQMVKTVKSMKAAGATMFCIACNTAHLFAPEVALKAKLPLLNMINLTLQRVRGNVSGQSCRVGLLCSDATAQLGVYHKHVKDSGVQGLELFFLTMGGVSVFRQVFCASRLGKKEILR